MEAKVNNPSTFVGPGAMRLERLLPGPVERVWAYLTEGKKRAQWICGGEWDLRVGARITMEFDNDRLPNDGPAPEKFKGKGKFTSTGVITRLEPMRLLAHTWTWESGDTLVTYELTPKGKDVLLTITHQQVKERGAVVSVMAGWDVHTGILEDLLRGTPPRPLWSNHTRRSAVYEPLVP